MRKSLSRSVLLGGGAVLALELALVPSGCAAFGTEDPAPTSDAGSPPDTGTTSADDGVSPNDGALSEAAPDGDGGRVVPMLVCSSGLACECPVNTTCPITCPVGGCKIECRAGSRCNVTCNLGCTIDCGKGAICKYDPAKAMCADLGGACTPI